MTFGRFIINLRRRLQDLRTSSGTVISDITQSGVRYSSAHIIEIANAAILEATRLVSMYSTSPLMHQLASGVVIGRANATVTNGSMNLPSTVMAVLSVISEQGDDKYEYVMKSPSEFSRLKVADYFPRDTEFAFERIFTVVQDLSANKRKLLLLPVDSGNITITYEYLINKSYVVAEASQEIFLTGIDDFLLDVAELEARKREGNIDMIRILQLSINTKLGIRTKE